MVQRPMDRRTFLTRAALLGAGLASTSALGTYPRSARAIEGRPNILFILTDDQPPQAAMTDVIARMDRDWTKTGYSDMPYCGPARVSLFTGKYPHNHGAVGNQSSWKVYKQRGYAKNDLLSRVNASGYRVGFFGKVINGYGSLNDATWVHPGADIWEVLVDTDNMYSSPYRINNGGKVHVRDMNPTEYFGRKAEEFVRRSATSRRPWFCYLSVTDPHSPYAPLPQHRHLHDGKRWTSPGVQEKDLSDKSNWTKKRGGTNARRLQNTWEGKLEELEAVQEQTLRLLDALDETGEASNTIVIVTSDNGYMLGEHRLSGKKWPYEESARVPFHVRIPGSNLPKSLLVSRLDVTATILKAAGASMRGIDGRSFYRATSATPWRKRVLVEGPGLKWKVLRQGRYAYMRLPTGEEELYDLSVDPYQNESLRKGRNKRLYADLRKKCTALSKAKGARLRALER